jgi:hypothetical protein
MKELLFTLCLPKVALDLLITFISQCQDCFIKIMMNLMSNICFIYSYNNSMNKNIEFKKIE